MRTHISTLKSVFEGWNYSFHGNGSRLDFSSVIILDQPDELKITAGMQSFSSLLPVYIVRSSLALTSLPKASLWIIINDSSARSFPEPNQPYFMIEDDVSADEIYQRIMHELFEDHLFESMYHDVLHEMAKNTDMNSVLRIFSSYLNAPFTIMSPARRVLASSFPKDTAILSQYPITKNMRATLERGYLVEESVNFIKEHAGLDILKSQEPNKVIRIKASEDLDVLAVDLVVHNQFIGALVMYGFFRRLTEADIEIMNHLRSFVLVLINYNTKISRQYSAVESYFIFDLVTQNLSKELALKQAKERGITTRGWLKGFLIAKKENSKSKNIPLLMYSTNLEMLLGNRFSVIIDDRFLIISELGDSPTLGAQKQERLSKYLKENQLLCAVSNPFSDITDTVDIWKQASFLIDEYGSSSDGTTCLFFHDHINNWILREFRNLYPMKSFFSNSLLLLQEYDKKNETEYYKTLETYIACGCSLLKCAEQLGIHYNTAKYRMNIIKRIGNIDLSTPDEIANITTYLELNK